MVSHASSILPEGQEFDNNDSDHYSWSSSEKGCLLMRHSQSVECTLVIDAIVSQRVVLKARGDIHDNTLPWDFFDIQHNGLQLSGEPMILNSEEDRKKCKVIFHVLEASDTIVDYTYIGRLSYRPECIYKWRLILRGATSDTLQHPDHLEVILPTTASGSE